MEFVIIEGQKIQCSGAVPSQNHHHRTFMISANKIIIQKINMINLNDLQNQSLSNVLYRIKKSLLGSHMQVQICHKKLFTIFNNIGPCRSVTMEM